MSSNQISSIKYRQKTDKMEEDRAKQRRTSGYLLFQKEFVVSRSFFVVVIKKLIKSNIFLRRMNEELFYASKNTSSESTHNPKLLRNKLLLRVRPKS